MSLISVEDALDRLLAPAVRLKAETVPLTEAGGRILAEPIVARRTHPPFDGSAMDGYAVRAQDVATLPARLRVIGESAAGRRFAGRVGKAEAVRIFTGAPVPDGADTILVQENATSAGSDLIDVDETVAPHKHIRRAGLDFREGDVLLDESRLIDPATLALIAAADIAEVPVVRRPLVAVLATGDELVAPGAKRTEDQIVASNSYGIAEMVRLCGGLVLDLGIVADDVKAIGAALCKAQGVGADIIVTLGGASVGDHDLVGKVFQDAGVALSFWKIAMRPGKPLMAGRLGNIHVLGLPGNPVSSLVCGHLFLRPLLARLQGLSHDTPLVQATLTSPLPQNDHRQDYIRAVATRGPDGILSAAPLSVQDSSMLSGLARANCLIVRKPNAEAAEIGAETEIIVLRTPRSP